jgi:HlyD family secretion protein
MPMEAKVTFVSPEAQFTPKQVETKSEREKLMFRVKVELPANLVVSKPGEVKTGLRGVAQILLDQGHSLSNLPSRPAAARN